MRKTAMVAVVISGCYFDATAFIPVRQYNGPVTEPFPAASGSPNPGASQAVTDEPLAGKTAAPSAPERTIVFKGLVSGEAKLPRIAVSKAITGCMNLDARVMATVMDTYKTPFTSTADTRPDPDGRYSLAIQDTEDRCIARMLMAWDDQDANGAFTWYEAGRNYEPVALIYVWIRKDGRDGVLTRGAAGPVLGFNEADFTFR